MQEMSIGKAIAGIERAAAVPSVQLSTVTDEPPSQSEQQDSHASGSVGCVNVIELQPICFISGLLRCFVWNVFVPTFSYTEWIITLGFYFANFIYFLEEI